MIEFKVTIRALETGQISIQCETFPGMATMPEHDAAHEFMKMFREFTLKGGKTTIIQDFKGNNDAKRN